MAKWTLGGLAYLLVLAVVVRVSADLLTPALPLLVTLLAIVVVVRRLWRGY